jgi:outer membrane protein TolC
VDVEAALRRALATRTDLDQSHKQLQANDVSVKTLSDARLPALDLTASYGVAGVGGPLFIRSGLGGTISQTISKRLLGRTSHPGRSDRADVETSP